MALPIQPPIVRSTWLKPTALPVWSAGTPERINIRIVTKAMPRPIPWKNMPTRTCEQQCAHRVQPTGVRGGRPVPPGHGQQDGRESEGGEHRPESEGGSVVRDIHDQAGERKTE